MTTSSSRFPRVDTSKSASFFEKPKRIIALMAISGFALLFVGAGVAAYLGSSQTRAPMMPALADAVSAPGEQTATVSPALAKTLLLPAKEDVGASVEAEARVEAPSKAVAVLSVAELLEDRKTQAPVPLSEAELRQELLKVLVVGLEMPLRVKSMPRRGSRPGSGAGSWSVPTRPDWESLHGRELAAKMPAAAGLPFRAEKDCQLTASQASELQRLSATLREALGEAAWIEHRESRAEMIRLALRRNFVKQKLFGSSEGPDRDDDIVPALMQSLASEDRFLSRVLVTKLAHIRGQSSSEALAKLVLFDPSEEIRLLALESLNKRHPEEFRHVLLDGVRYPWPPVAAHAAAAFVQLKDREAVPALMRLAQEEDPRAPRPDAKEGYTVRQVVRINHLRNCHLCHAGSTEPKDPVRGRVPPLDRPLATGAEYYQDDKGIFVRADITYLKQDFSVWLPVENPEPWPALQRFDFVVRTRRATDEEVAAYRERPADTSYPQREAVLWALKELAAKAATPKGP